MSESGRTTRAEQQQQEKRRKKENMKKEAEQREKQEEEEQSQSDAGDAKDEPSLDSLFICPLVCPSVCLSVRFRPPCVRLSIFVCVCELQSKETFRLAAAAAAAADLSSAWWWRLQETTTTTFERCLAKLRRDGRDLACKSL